MLPMYRGDPDQLARVPAMQVQVRVVETGCPLAVLLTLAKGTIRYRGAERRGRAHLSSPSRKAAMTLRGPSGSRSR